MGYEANQDAAHDYLVEHYREMIEYQDIIDFIESIDPSLNHEDLYELQNIINKKLEVK
ncbi:hypothetical protein LCGC14_0531210 [marine sediment metagenome]|uniref:Uncharacterized protein n=1 Tax=marine sediment metagenome TaxID=412755 RepID=A0A0F9RVJ7_9ZZZZ